MSKEEVLKIMGAPLVSDFEYNVDEWFYCKKGSLKAFSSLVKDNVNVVLYFYKERLIKKVTYDTPYKNHLKGSCQEHIRSGSYKIPDMITEIRSQYWYK